jgi:uncharacterized phosphosugar-binding protein
MITAYFDRIRELLRAVEREEAAAMEAAARAVARCVAAGGVIHAFGCGHSHILCEEIFYRAGGLACIHPIFDTGLMLNEGALRSSDLERMVGYGATLMKREDIRPGEVLFVVSTSGRNPVPVEVALAGKEKGATVVAVTSRAYSGSQPPRHPSGKKLMDVGDIVIDNHVPPGDAILSLPGLRTPFGPGSTVVGAAILNGILARAVQLMTEAGVEPPVFFSGNLEGTDAHNRALAERYRPRVPALK